MTAQLTGIGVGFTWDGHDGPSTWGAYVINSDLPPLPNTRDLILDIPGRTGIYDYGTELSELDFTIVLGFYSAIGRADLKQKVRNFIAAVDPRNGYKQYSLEEDPTFYLLIKPTASAGSISNTDLAVGTAEVMATLSLPVRCADPHWYSTAHPQTTVMATSSAAGSISNPGGASSPATVTLTATAAVTGPITVTIAGVALTYLGNLVSGDVVTIDTGNWTMLQNGAQAIDQWSDQMPQVPAGNSSVTVNKAGITARVTYTPRWVA